MDYEVIAYCLLLAICYGIGCHFSAENEKLRGVDGRLAVLLRHTAQLAVLFWVGLFWIGLLPTVFFDVVKTPNGTASNYWGVLAVKALIVFKAVFGIGGVFTAIVDFVLKRQARIKEINEIRRGYGEGDVR